MRLAARRDFFPWEAHNYSAMAFFLAREHFQGARMAGVMMAIACLALAISTPISLATEFHRFEHNGRVIEYVLILPAHFNKTTPYPVLLALPPGDQSRELVEDGLRLYWEPQAKKRGWVVISPAAPKGETFYSGAETELQALLEEISKSVIFEGGKVHLAGFSNGGRSAYRMATTYPELILSLTVLPGAPPDERAARALDHLRGIPVAAFAGGDDAEWVRASRETKKELDRLGIENTLEVIPGEGHVMRLEPAKLFDLLDKRRRKN
jgi:poly(3-hydroxybutyrate) depolymerase